MHVCVCIYIYIYIHLHAHTCNAQAGDGKYATLLAAVMRNGFGVNQSDTEAFVLYNKAANMVIMLHLLVWPYM